MEVLKERWTLSGNILKRMVSVILIEKVGAFLTTISPELNTRYSYFLFNRRFIHLDPPRSFAEKLSWLKLHVYNNNELVQRCSDKLRVRDYIKEQGLGHLLNDLYGYYQSSEEIDLNQLPRAFVLKWNFGSGFNFVCNDKAFVDWQKVMMQFHEWGTSKFWLYFSELQYDIPNKFIICEKFLETSHLLDYKLYCFHGEVKAVLVMAKIDLKTDAAVFMTPDWEYISDVGYKYKKSFLPAKPETLEEMKQAAAKLSKPFPFVRIDFYEYKGRAVFGEMTFTPTAGLIPSETEIDGMSMGDMINLKEFL